MTDAPILIRNHLWPVYDAKPLLIVHGDRVLAPSPSVVALIGRFQPDGADGFVAAARAADGKYGYLSGEGKWLIAPYLDAAFNFSHEGLARFCEGGKWGFIDLSCQVILEPRFEDAQGFGQGVAPVMVDGLWRYVDRDGKFLFAAGFKHAQRFTASGLALAGAGRRQELGFIDRNGGWVIQPRFTYAYSFDGHAVTPASLDGDAYGLIDTSGNWVKRPARMRIRAFNSDGLAHFSLLDRHGYGYLDTTGRVVMEADYLEDHMRHGLVQDGENSFRSLQGKLRTSETIQWTSAFTEHGFAIAKRYEGAPAESWGLLGIDGTFTAAPAEVSEPVTDCYTRIVWPEAGTPLATFATHDGDVALVDAAGAIAYRLTREAQGDRQAPVLSNAAGREIWRGDAEPWLPGQGYYFNAVGESYLEGLEEIDDIDRVAAAMAEEVEARLHAFVDGALAEDVDDEDDDPYYDEPDALTQAARQVGTGERIYRDYLDESVGGNYPFLSGDRIDLGVRMEQQLIARLTARYGPPVASSDFPDGAAEPVTCGWPIPLSRPVADGEGASVNQLWLAIGSLSDTGDGDSWFDIYLHCLPGVGALQAAMGAAGIAFDAAEEEDSSDDGDLQHAVMEGGDDDEDDEDDEEEQPEDGFFDDDSHLTELLFGQTDATPRTHAEWMARLTDMPGDICAVPPHLVDDAMADLVAHAFPVVFDSLAAKFQTEARLEAVIRAGVEAAIALPTVCMTASALALARSLYGEDSHWNDRDEPCSRLPEGGIDRFSLHSLWGALIDEQLALKAIEAGADLDRVPLWLRTEALEQLALERSPYNAMYLDQDKVTEELILRAVNAGYPLVMRCIPESRRTLEICIAAVRLMPAAIAGVPAALRDTVRSRIGETAR